MDNKQLFEDVLATFDNNDSDGLLNLITDDFIWEMVGDQTVNGKAALKKMFDDTPEGMKMTGNTKDIKIVDGDKAACNGMVTMQNAKGETTESYYCDLYEFESGKLKRMVTFIKPKKK